VTFDYDIRNRPLDNVVDTRTPNERDFAARSVSVPMPFPRSATVSEAAPKSILDRSVLDEEMK
jgi:hypothetical protein